MARQLDIIEVEQWRDVPSWPGRKVSSMGRVRGIRGGVLRTFTLPNGYEFLPGKHGTKSGSTTIHRMVCEAFIGPAEPGMQVHHRNNVKTDNRLYNLEYVTPSENAMHKHGHGTMCVGEKNARAKMTTDKVREIRARYAAGESPYQIAVNIGISRTQVDNIVNRRQWRHV